ARCHITALSPARIAASSSHREMPPSPTKTLSPAELAKLEHAFATDPASDAGYEVWDLLTRNAQAVTAGLYLYTVQSSQGVWSEDGLKNTHVGKIVILK
ncbi:MAG: hypothetical protein L0209_12030, partial [candidate division Zixibacteria bacterium]|nr:hypothetical protein [candidate division Zixibacteria bacterium]